MDQHAQRLFAWTVPATHLPDRVSDELPRPAEFEATARADETDLARKKLGKRKLGAVSTWRPRDSCLEKSLCLGRFVTSLVLFGQEDRKEDVTLDVLV